MEEAQLTDEEARWHRTFAAQCNNQAWDLAAQAKRTAAEEQRMLYLAYAAAYHWSVVGQPIHAARAEVTLAHVQALAGDGHTALGHARRALELIGIHGGEDWDAAFAHAEMAHAAAVLGDGELHAPHYTLARQLGEAIQDPEDRQAFLSEFERIPAEV